MSLLDRLFNRRPAPARGDTAAAGTMMRPINAELETLRSTLTRMGSEWYTTLRTDFDYDDRTLAETYAAGLTAYACANVGATIISSIPLQVKTSDGDVLLHSPVESFIKQSSTNLWYNATDLYLWGKSYYRKRNNIYFHPTQVERLSPLDVSVRYDPVAQTITNYTIAHRAEPLPPAQVINIHTFHPINDIDGISAYEVAMRRIQAERNLVDYAAAFFFNMARPDAVLINDSNITQGQADTAIAQFRKQFKGAQNAWKVGFLGGGKWDLKTFTFPPVDLAMGELKDQIRSDICAAFQVSPILIGIGNAGDPLGAANTYEQAYRQFVVHTAIPRVNLICEALNAQWVEADFKPFGKQIHIEPDLADVLGATLATAERGATAAGAVSAHIWTVNEARAYTGKDQVDGLIARDPAWAIALFTAGAIRRSQLQTEVGLEPDHLSDGYVYEVDPRAAPPPPSFGPPAFSNPPSLPPGPPPLALPSGGEKPPPPPAPSPLPAWTPVKSASRAPARIELPAAAMGGETPAYITLSLANDPDLIAIQQNLKAETGAPAIEWSDPATFHVTLVYCTAAPDLAALSGALPAAIQPIDLELAALGTFEGNDPAPIVLHVAPGAALSAIQAGLAAACHMMPGTALSEYSEPPAYKPHITLGYQPAALPLPTYTPPAPPLTVTAGAIELATTDGADGFTTIYQSAPLSRASRAGVITLPYAGAAGQFVTVAGDNSVKMFMYRHPDGSYTTEPPADLGRGDITRSDARIIAALDELSNWQRKVKRKGAASPFTPEFIADPLSGWVREHLTQGWDSAAIFEAAKTHLRTGPRAEPAPAPYGATPEEYAAYWHRYDELKHDLGADWLAYQTRLSAAIPRQADQNDVILHLDGAIDVNRHLLESEWVGTKDAPGSLYGLILAGMAAGNEALNREKAINPNRAAPVTLETDWLLSDDAAYEYAKRYAGALIRRIDETTRQSIRDALAAYSRGELDAAGLEQAITDILIVEGSTPSERVTRRAQLIADNESIIAYNSGSMERWTQAGVDRAKWQTVRQGEPHPVCEICRPMHNLEADISTGWTSPYNGVTYTTSAHVGCRCFRRPVVG